MNSSIMSGITFFDPQERAEGKSKNTYVEGDFVRQRLYGCQLVVTNISCVELQLTALLQIPAGSIAVGSKANSLRTEFLNLGVLPSLSLYHFVSLQLCHCCCVSL